MSDLQRTSSDNRYDLSNHMPIDPSDGFEEAGYRFKGWQPANDSARRVAVIQAYKDEELKDEIVVPLMYTNIFGLNVADVMEIEAATDHLIVELGGESIGWDDDDELT
jgi:hypothetical protein